MRPRRRAGRPGVTAAATTAVFATGEGPGETALATTAVLATGWPMTPTLPTRAALSGISVSFGCRRFVGLDGGDDHANGSGVDQREQLPGHLAGEVARSRWELHDDVVDGAELVQ